MHSHAFDYGYDMTVLGPCYLDLPAIMYYNWHCEQTKQNTFSLKLLFVRLFTTAPKMKLEGTGPCYLNSNMTKLPGCGWFYDGQSLQLSPWTH